MPTDRVFRMLLSLLKRNPAGIVKDVGVQLMLFASSIEVTKVCPPAPALDQSRGSNRGTELERRKQRDQRGELERQAEATCILTLARRAERSRAISMAETGGDTLNGTNATPTANTKKKRCKLRKTIKVEDGLQDWAAKSGHNISEFVRLLGLFRGIEPADAKLVRDRVVRIPAGAAAKVGEISEARDCNYCVCLFLQNLSVWLFTTWSTRERPVESTVRTNTNLQDYLPRYLEKTLYDSCVLPPRQRAHWAG